MDILPAIDLKDGKAVRLTKGLMESAKIYSNEPWEVAKVFEEMGSSWVHLVDLNGAFAGEPKNLEQIEKIRQNCQFLNRYSDELFLHLEYHRQVLILNDSFDEFFQFAQGF